MAYNYHIFHATQYELQLTHNLGNKLAALCIGN